MKHHQLIFRTYEQLRHAESFVLVTGHDAKPLYYRFEAEHAGQFSLNYLQQGPTVWQIDIALPNAGKTPLMNLYRR